MKKLVYSGLASHLFAFLATGIILCLCPLRLASQCMDLAPPTPVCHQTLAIPLDNTGVAIIPASAFNAASQDDCGHTFFKVKRMTAPVGYTCANPGNPNNMFDDFIQFCCEDIANNEIMVILRVYDEPPVPGPVPDDYLEGDFNDCMVQVEVQDKLPPAITCPSDLTISCIFPFTPDNLDVFGEVATDPAEQDSICIDDPGVPGDPGLQCIGIDGLAEDNCNVVVTSEAIIDINNCGIGTITRTFTATDDGGLQATCQQIVSVINYDPFDLSDITWPPDFTTTNICEIDSLSPDNLPPPFNAPVLNEGPCDLVGASYEDMVFDFSNFEEACFKILRTWTVIDWCQLNTSAGGIWTHMQVIKVMNNVEPVIAPIEDTILCSFDPDCGGLTLDFEAEATDDCSGAASLTWTYSVDIDNDNSFDFISPAIIGASIEFSFDMPIGTHRILYSVSDQCGNVATEEQIVTLESCVGPSAKCIHGLSTNLMAVDLDGDGEADWGMVTVLAEMFDAGSSHPCGNSFTLAFSEDPSDVSMVFDCDDVGENEVELWAIDENGLTDFCITTIDIQDNNDVCPQGIGGGGVISGSISVPESGKLAGAMVYLDGSNSPGTPSSVNGYYVFPSMPFGGQYIVRPVKSGDEKNGVTALDLVKIQKHLLGLEKFTSPFQYIAADANNSQSVSAVDIIQLRKLILGFDDVLPNNQSWRFIDASHFWPDSLNPWASSWNETYSINPFSSDMNGIDFNAVKVGDLNQSASINATEVFIEPRSFEPCYVEYLVSLQEENIYKVEVSLKEAGLYNALQFSFDWNKLDFELVDWLPADEISEDDFRMPVNQDQAASIAIFPDSEWKDESKALMTLWFQKRANASGKFKLYLKGQPTPPYAYLAETEEVRNVNLIGKVMIHQTTLSNHPNPFRDLTHIMFTSSAEEDATLRVFDPNGKLIFTRYISLVEGENEYVVRKSELPGTGMYFYEIQSPLQYSTNRMIIVN